MDLTLSLASAREHNEQDKVTDSYLPEMAAVAKAMAKLGATDFEIYNELGISKPCYYRWRWKHPDFAAAIMVGKKAADERVEAALYSRAVGYDHVAVKIMTVSDGAGEGSHIEKVEYVEHVVPDPRAIEYWLNNRRPSKWSSKVVQELSGSLKFENIQRDDKDMSA